MSRVKCLTPRDPHGKPNRGEVTCTLSRSRAPVHQSRDPAFPNRHPLCLFCCGKLNEAEDRSNSAFPPWKSRHQVIPWPVSPYPTSAPGTGGMHEKRKDRLLVRGLSVCVCVCPCVSVVWLRVFIRASSDATYPGHPRPSQAIPGNPKQSQAIPGNPRQSTQAIHSGNPGNPRRAGMQRLHAALVCGALACVGTCKRAKKPPYRRLSLRPTQPYPQGPKGGPRTKSGCFPLREIGRCSGAMVALLRHHIILCNYS